MSKLIAVLRGGGLRRWPHEWRHESEWLAALPQLVAECAAAWDIEPEEPIDTPYSLVVSRTRGGSSACGELRGE